MSNEAKILGGISLLAILMAVGAAFLFGNPSASLDGTLVDTSKLVRSDSHFTGPKDAKVVLVEFGDFQCPGCRGVSSVVEQIQKDYKEKIKVVFRNFPLGMHKHAIPASRVAEAAGAQGKFWEMSHLLFQKQAEWEGLESVDAVFLSLAKELKLDEAKFKSALSSEEVRNKVERDMKDGTDVGVTGTPTFFINGKQYRGSYTYDAMKQELDTLLK